MLKFVILFAVNVLCQADPPVTPPSVFCGEIPTAIYRCLGNPHLVARDVTAQCASKTKECERIQCIFEKSGWMNGDAIDKSKLTSYFDQFAKDHPAWTPAVNQVKISCLSGTLPTQGPYFNCPAYDIMHCALSSFFKNAQPSQWSTSEDCTYPRQFAAACPICPENCFAPAIPYGSCNACKIFPRTP